MRTLSLVLLGLVFVALMHQSEAHEKGWKKKAAQKMEDCILKAEKADPTAKAHTVAEDCKNEVEESDGGEDGDADFFGDLMSKMEGIIDKVLDGFGDVGKKGKEFVGKVKGKIDGFVKGIKD